MRLGVHNSLFEKQHFRICWQLPQVCIDIHFKLIGKLSQFTHGGNYPVPAELGFTRDILYVCKIFDNRFKALESFVSRTNQIQTPFQAYIYALQHRRPPKP